MTKSLSSSFGQPENLAVLICTRVFEGAPVLQVTHDEDGGWQFLCGGAHGEDVADEPKIVCLEEVLKRDKSLIALADLCINEVATRESRQAAWERHDDYEETVRANIAEHGWHVAIIEPSETEPGFAYSIGLFETFRRPEIVIYGLPTEVMHWIINEVGGRYRGGGELVAGEPADGFLEGYPVVFREVKRERYRGVLGYGLWYYDGDGFPALQCVWPDKKGKFPWEAGFEERCRRMQPLLG